MSCLSLWYIHSPKKGDLTNGNVNKSNEREHQIAIEAQANDPNLMNDEDQVDTVCPTQDISQLMNVKKTERNKFFGSLPNHLDSDETYRENSKYEDHYVLLWLPLPLPLFTFTHRLDLKYVLFFHS